MSELRVKYHSFRTEFQMRGKISVTVNPKIIVKLRQGSGKVRQGKARKGKERQGWRKVKGLKA